MATAVFAEALDNAQHSRQITPISQSYTLYTHSMLNLSDITSFHTVATFAIEEFWGKGAHCVIGPFSPEHFK
jgi:hypothetical protein